MDSTEREAELTVRLAALEARLAELEASAGRASAGTADEHGVESIESLVARLLPSEVRGHMRAARKEQLLAARAMLDHWIARVDRKPAERVRRRESIKLDVE